MSDDRDDNIFDKDDALDYIMFEECEKDVRSQKGGRGGCLGSLILLFTPAFLLAAFAHQ